MTDLTALAALVPVTAAACAAAEARMAALRGEASRIAAQIADLDAARRARSAGVTAADAALRAGADLRWERWVEQRRAALQGALARQRALIEAERPALTLALGRKIVAEELRAQAEAARIRAQERRAERGW